MLSLLCLSFNAIPDRDYITQSRRDGVYPLPENRVGSGHGPDRSASLKIGTGSKISTMVMTMVPNKGCRIKNISYSAQISCLLNFNQNIVCTLSAQKKIYSINSYCG